jgi:hypothetical protein
MPRIDDYKMARKVAIDKLKNESFKYLVNKSGFKAVEDNIIEIPFLGSVYLLEYPNFSLKDNTQPDREVPLTEQVLIFHYLLGKKPLSLSGEWISYREIPGASFYIGPFTARAITPMVKVFGRNLELFEKVFKKLGGKEVSYGDKGFEYYFFPLVPVRLILWEGDEEFPPSGNILFDVTISDILSPEDVAWLCGMLVYKLIGLSKSL